VNSKPFLLFLIIVSIAMPVLISISLLEIVNESLLFSFVVMAVMNTIFLIYYIKKYGNTSSVDLVVVFISCFMLYTMAYPMDFLLGSVKNLQESIVIKGFSAYLLANVGLIFGIIISHLFFKKKTNKALYQVQFESSTKVWATLVIILGLALMCYEQYKMGGLSVLGLKNRLAYFLSKRMYDESSMTIPWREILNAGIFVLSLAIVKKKGAIRFLLFLGFLYSYYLFILGGRSNILMSFLPVLAIFVEKGLIKLNKKRIITLLISMLLLISPLFSIFREQLMGVQNADSLSSDRMAFSQGETGSAFQINANLLQYDRRTFEEVNASYLSGVLHTVPSFLYKYVLGHDKYPNLSNWYVKTYQPATYKAGGGLGFSPVSQAWLYGGYLGIFTVFFVLGFLLHWVNMESRYKYLLLPFCFIFQRGSFHDVVISLLFTFAGIIFILAMSSLFKSKKHTTSLQNSHSLYNQMNY